MLQVWVTLACLNECCPPHTLLGPGIQPIGVWGAGTGLVVAVAEGVIPWWCWSCPTLSTLAPRLPSSSEGHLSVSHWTGT